MTEIKWKPFKDWLYIDIHDRGEQKTASGIIVPDDDMKDFGIRPRWCTVISVGSEFPDKDIKPGDEVLVEHLGWSKGLRMDTLDGETIKVWGTKEEKILLHKPASEERESRAANLDRKV